MARSLWKGPFSEISIQKEGPTRVWSRRSTILPIHIEGEFQIHNGKSFVNLRVSEDMIGHKFGEFAITRKKTVYKKKTGQGKSRK